jgi:hypothetical protein
MNHLKPKLCSFTWWEIFLKASGPGQGQSASVLLQWHGYPSKAAVLLFPKFVSGSGNWNLSIRKSGISRVTSCKYVYLKQMVVNKYKIYYCFETDFGACMKSWCTTWDCFQWSNLNNSDRAWFQVVPSQRVRCVTPDCTLDTCAG